MHKPCQQATFRHLHSFSAPRSRSRNTLKPTGSLYEEHWNRTRRIRYDDTDGGAVTTVVASMRSGGSGPLEATFMFVDMAGYTALTEAHGAEVAADCVGRFVGWTREALGDTGRLIDRVGDAVFVMTPSPALAVRFVARLFATASKEPDFPILRAGLHHGEALERDGFFFGATINLAARVAAQARGGQALATEPVAAAARGEGIVVSSLGRMSLRHVRDPIELFELHFEAPSSDTDAIDPVCRMRVARKEAVGQLRFNGLDYWFCSMSCAARFSAAPEAFLRNAGSA